ncbi:dolichyl-phosphate-mannose--protein mannosyltransferase [Microbacterium sp. HMH0099]|uniref:dolichyl-phosphate-mannose--protein mannosyltransferase n=1 Tax=Microbacterium sp. HMH0099 TaxID=3414026 RepID=UPI003BF752E2
MSAPVETLPSATEPSRLDMWRDAVRADPRRVRLWRWLAPAIVTLVAFALRVFRIGDPHQLVFDETYYVKDSWSQWVLGYPSTWPDGADESFAAGDTDVFTGIGSYVVHPPLGRILIGAGMWLFGPDTSTGWRISAAIFGTLTVLLVYLVARSMGGSIVLASVASGLLAIDGLGIVLSRIALLDVFLTFFIVLTFWFVILDRRRTQDRIAALVAAREDGPPTWGPVLWDRPWLVAAGLAAGAATGVKWSGLYVLAAVGLYVVVTDALARRRAGVVQWPVDAALRQGPVSFLLLVPAALVVYLASWSGWLLTTGGFGRANEVPAEGFWAWVPLPLQNLWAYHEQMYAFHVGLTSGHSYASPAWQWPLLIRPTSMWWHQDAAGQSGCLLPNGCTEAVSSIPNPLIWWAGIAAAVYLLVRVVLVREWRFALVLVGLAATYVPWLLYPERTIFQFYTVAMVPFLVLGLAFALRDVCRGMRGMPRRSGQLIVVVFLVACVVISAFWYPVWTALPVPYEFWRLHNWLPSWI